MLRAIPAAALICPILLLLPGCGTNRPQPVDGTVKLSDGSDISKLQGYTITCEANDPGPDGKKPSATGEIGADGKFQLSTNATNDGAYPGTYKVALTPPLPFGDERPKPYAIAEKYKSLVASDLTITVEAKPTPVTITVEPAGM